MAAHRPTRAPTHTPRAAAKRRRVAAAGASALLLAGAALLAPRPAHAMTALDEGALSQVHGQAGLQLPRGDLKRLPLVGGLLALFTPQQLRTTVLDATQFQAALAERGATALPAALYDGRPVAQVTIDAPPVDARMEAGALLNTLGVQYNGPSFGTIDIHNLDARGTTLWMWGH